MIKISIFLIYLISSINYVLAEGYSVGNIVIPFTDSEHLIPCSEFVDEQYNFDLSLQCYLDTRGKSGQDVDIELPECYVVSEDSPDIVKTDEYNYIRLSIFDYFLGVLGFYFIPTGVIYIAETYDVEFIYRHEVGHYILGELEGDSDGAHLDIFWIECSTQYYDPSEESKEYHN